MPRPLKLDGSSVALCVLGGITFMALGVTFPMKDAPAWWQAVMSGSALFLTTILWHRDKQHMLERADDERRNLHAMVWGCVQKVSEAAREVAVAAEAELHGQKKYVVAERIRETSNRIDHLRLFSPYDRLGTFKAVNSLGDVEVCGRKLTAFVAGQERRRMEFSGTTSPRNLDQMTALNMQEVAKAANELVDRCDAAITILEAGTH
ncbi:MULTISPECIES: hypothetical protein [Lysobacter]|uniref:hypothetical protein n=1 Tax=Lysobacter TaxID=68 RepID=UPI001F21EAA5|nr:MULTISPECIES: hypothetical protein [Lysobacter]UJB21667.1 hypothetical protein L1A79_11700 [Lysobacter capsici]UJQ29216.1 hypothetical protein L2D09_03165 [Lysobacter gummosus]